MGLPSITITFTEKARTAKKRMDRGNVGLILKGTVPSKNPVVVMSENDIPETLPETSQEQIKLALLGNEKSPQKVVAYFVATDATDYSEATEYFQTNKVNYLAAPTVATDEALEEVETWIKSERSEGRTIKAVLPGAEADNEGIINFVTSEIVCGEKTYTAEAYCARIAGIIASTEVKSSCTYTAVPEIDAVPKMTRAEMGQAVDAGKLLLFHDGEKVKIARGVNSLQTITAEKGEQFKKIKIVDVMDTVKDDITKTIEDVYIGKYTNTYDNKCLLVSAIKDYLGLLEKEGVVQVQSVEIDIQATKQYLIEKDEDVSEMTDDEIKMADTGDKVFIEIAMKIFDVIEEVIIPITV